MRAQREVRNNGNKIIATTTKKKKKNNTYNAQQVKFGRLSKTTQQWGVWPTLRGVAVAVMMMMMWHDVA